MDNSDPATPRPTRRALLLGTAAALAAGLAGCEFRHVPATDTTSEAPPGGGSTLTGDRGSTQDGSRSPTPTKTVTSGRTFSVDVTNRITSDDLRRTGLDPELPATVTVIVEEQWSDGTENELYRKRLDVAPGSERSLGDVFTAKRHGPSYIVRTKLKEYPGDRRVMARDGSAVHRFTPGGYGSPAGTTFEIVVAAYTEGSKVCPHIELRGPSHDE